MNDPTLTIIHGRLIHRGSEIPDSVVVVRGSTIVYAGKSTGERPRGGRMIDAGGCCVGPGFIDLHAHGASGADFLSGDAGDAREIAATHARYGTTALFATVRSAPGETMRRAVACLGDMIRSGKAGGIVGIHIEGPFLNPARAGVHPVEHLRLPDPDELGALMAPADGCPMIVTLAPELPGARGLIEAIAARGGIPAAGHSDASYREACEAFGAGVRSVTHLFNAMSGMHHRRPGLAAAALANVRVVAELIADGMHVHPEMVKMALKLKGRDGIILVTDCMQALDAETHAFRVGGKEVTIRGGTPVLEDGTLCGSVLTMSGALRNVRQWTGAPPADVAALATSNPARLAGIDARKGALAPGMDADIVIFDEKFGVRTTIIGGEVAYAAPGSGLRRGE
ncbi:MAG: N-acetylglucosamine-6-phosphate deacetylase [Chlamydiota bacterium]